MQTFTSVTSSKKMNIITASRKFTVQFQNNKLYIVYIVRGFIKEPKRQNQYIGQYACFRDNFRDRFIKRNGGQWEIFLRHSNGQCQKILKI